MKKLSALVAAAAIAASMTACQGGESQQANAAVTEAATVSETEQAAETKTEQETESGSQDITDTLSLENYFDAGTFDMINGKGSNFKSSLSNPFTLNEKELTIESEAANGTDFTFNFADTGVSQGNGKYTYIAKSTGTIAGNNTSAIEWEIKAWPENQNNSYAPATVEEVSDNWLSLYEQAAPEWRSYDLGTDAHPWLDITTIGMSDNTSVGGMNICWSNVVNTPMTGTASQDHYLTYGDGSPISVYAYGQNPTGKFNDIITELNPDIANLNGQKADYPLYQIPAYINAFWVENEIPSIIAYHSSGRETISGLRLDEMNSTISIDKTGLAGLKNGYKYSDAVTFLPEMTDAEIAGINDVALTWTSGSFGVPQTNDGKAHSMPAKFVSDNGNGTVLSLGVNAQRSVFDLVGTFGKIDRHALNSACGSMDIGNTRTSFRVTTNLKYSIAYGGSRVTNSANGDVDGN